MFQLLRTLADSSDDPIGEPDYRVGWSGCMTALATWSRETGGTARLHNCSDDAQTIGICRKILANREAQEDLVERDPDAPECGPNQERWETLLVEEVALMAELTKARLPKTPEGVQALAQAAMLFTDRTHEGDLSSPLSFAEWIKLAALSCAARTFETIPLLRRVV